MSVYGTIVQRKVNTSYATTSNNNNGEGNLPTKKTTMITKEELKTTVKVLKELAGMKVVHTEMRRGQLRDNEGKIER